MGRRVLLAAVAALATLAFAGGGSAIASGTSTGPVVHQITETPAEVKAFWTEARIEEAVRNGQPEPQPSSLDIFVTPAANGLGRVESTRGGFIQTAKKVKKSKYKARPVKSDARTGKLKMHGIALFELDGDLYSCSATVVNAPSKSLVWTAGHCMTDAAANDPYATSFAFIPAYLNGNTPFGVWPATSLSVPRGWLRARGYIGRAGSQLDFGAAVVAPQSGQFIEDVVGSRTLKFDGKRKQKFKIYGYPASSSIGKFTGEKPFYCKSKWYSNAKGMPKPEPIHVACQLTSGASGGGWVGEDGRIFAVTSYRSIYGKPPILGGVYQSAKARKLYDKNSIIEP